MCWILRVLVLYCCFFVTVQALEVMYNALNNPTELTGWKIGGGDPCGDSWKGITCDGSAVDSMYDILNDEIVA